MEKSETIIMITHENGLHARPADMLVRCANKFSSKILIANKTRNPEKLANAKSILGVLTIGARKGDMVILLAEGDDAVAAIDSMRMIIMANFSDKASN